jgi:DNA-binding transcriptional LysR family regulator
MSASKPLRDFQLGGMGQKIEPPVRHMNTHEGMLPGESHSINWSDVRYLVDVGESGSLRAAARSRRVTVNTVRARLSRLERAVGCSVVKKETSGTTLTEMGSRLCKAAKSLSDAPFWEGYASGQGLLVPNILTLGCTEGVGTSWLTPRIADLARRLSPITVDMQFDYDLRHDRSANVDLGLGYQRPADPGVIVAKLATFHFLLFASPGYIATHGMPTTIEELRGHSFVEQGGPGYNETAIDLLLGSDRDHTLTRVKTNSSLTQAYAAANGAGVAILPSYTRAISSALIPLPIVTNMRVPLYYFYHAEARHSTVLRTGIDWLQEIFDPLKFPWFGDRFVHPDQFSRRQVHDAQVVDIFKHMIDRTELQQHHDRARRTTR